MIIVALLARPPARFSPQPQGSDAPRVWPVKSKVILVPSSAPDEAKKDKNTITNKKKYAKRLLILTPTKDFMPAQKSYQNS
ncbi:MAG: hypothetical protein Q8O60_03945 [Deltaproteobacteria bacterium]|nr:hypothetical protein [Deltaproteobacteria bacterium]MDP3030129.1 hypothetical protein [Deltaproteobacteria bacterium]